MVNGISQDLRFNFKDRPVEGMIHVEMGAEGPPEYSEELGYGFVRHTCAMPPREVSFDAIMSGEEGFYVTVEQFDGDAEYAPDHYNHYGLAFRVKLPPGGYEIKVRTTSDAQHTMVAISGMHADKILHSGTWDAAGKVRIQHHASYHGHEWGFNYANGRRYLDIEIEPRTAGVPVGVEQIIIKPLNRRQRPDDEPPTIYILGDSTAKSYVFEEAPMNGWGQVLYRLFDLDQVRIVNYSQGGRSFRNAYAEGRFNDIALTGCEGDVVLIQFGHNDAREDEWTRYGRGSTEASYAAWIEDVYVPALQARGMIPILVTPTSIVSGDAAPGHVYRNSFQKRRFPDVMRELAAKLNLTLLDVNAASIRYYNELGVEGTTAIFMAIEAGESPAKMNDGSLANGHPANKIDGAHYKEALGKQYARMIVMELRKRAEEGDVAAQRIISYVKAEVQQALASGDWSKVYPETACDTIRGEGAYYRNQIEKMLQLGVMHKDEAGRFHPDKAMTTSEFITALCSLLRIDAADPDLADYADGELTREVMAAILYDAYHMRFDRKPAYMTDYNKRSVKPGDHGYDPNLDTGAVDAVYDPLIPYEELLDIGEIDARLAEKVEGAYRLGLIRAEKGIIRGKMLNGSELEPKRVVTRAKAAKVLYFMWILSNPVKRESHLLF